MTTENQQSTTTPVPQPKRSFLAKAAFRLILPFYVIADSSVALKEKLKIFGAIAYLLLPVDFIPDLIPILGITDDVTALVLLWRVLRKNISGNERVRTRAWARVDSWFPPKQ